MAHHTAPGSASDPAHPDAPGHLTSAFARLAERVGATPLDGVDAEDVRRAGAAAAAEGMSAGETVDLFLAATARVSASTPSGSRGSRTADHTLLEGIRVAVPVLVEGYQSVGRHLIRQEETARRDFIDDLLRGDADVASIVQRAEPFGLDLSVSHQVVVVGPRDGRLLDDGDQGILNRAVLAHYGDRDVLVTAKAGHLVALVPAGPTGADVDLPARRLHDAMNRSAPGAWRSAVGRPYPGAYGVARSYQQAREAIHLTERLHPDAAMVPMRDLLIYRVLGRDRVALADLVVSVLTPLTEARGGAGPLVNTLEAYFAAGEVATAAARQLHVSVRTVTYRLARVTALTGYDPTVPAQRLTLQAAVIGARLLPWPGTDQAALPEAP